MKADIAIEEIGSILLRLDAQEDLDEVVTYMSGFQGGSGESAMTLEELKEEALDPHIDVEAVEEAEKTIESIRIENATNAIIDILRNLSHEEQSTVVNTVLPKLEEEPSMDPDGPEDGGHPY